MFRPFYCQLAQASFTILQSDLQPAICHLIQLVNKLNVGASYSSLNVISHKSMGDNWLVGIITLYDIL